jgi:hypothetical protein
MTSTIQTTIAENWARITFAEGHYEVSDQGRVKSFYGNSEGQILKGGIVGGYLGVGIRVNGLRRRYLIHRLVAEFFIEKKSQLHKVVIHQDGNRFNNHFSNLAWVSTKESFKHTERFNPKVSEAFRSRDKKLQTNAKLTIDDVSHIKKMLKNGIKQNIIAKLFCVSEMQITRIKRGENWGDIDTPKRRRLIAKKVN